MQNNAPKSSRLETIAYGVVDAAKAVGISPQYLYKLRREGKIKISKIGGRAVIFRDELDRFIAEVRSAS